MAVGLQGFPDCRLSLAPLHAWACLGCPVEVQLCTALLLLCWRIVVDAWLQTRSQHAPAVLLRVISTYLQGSKRSLTGLHKRCSLP